MSREKLVIRDNSTLRAQYNSLQEGDIVVGRLRLRESEEPMLLDLGERRVHLIPSGLSQLASRFCHTRSIRYRYEHDEPRHHNCNKQPDHRG